MSELPAHSETFLPRQRSAPVRALSSVDGGGRLPVLPRTYIPRARLWQQLDRATQGVGITLLVAAAGAGKTLGVAGWLLERGHSRETLWAPRASDLSPERLSHLLLPPRPGAPSPLVVIDDAQELSAACLQLLDGLLQEAPERLRLVLLSRWDLPFTRLVPELLGHLTILRGDLCRLDRAETAELVAAHVPNASDELVDTIAGHAYGWCAAVVLIARTAATSPAPLPAAHSATQNFSAVDRVAREAFAALSPQQRHVLLCVAQEDSVSAALARHLSNDPSAEDVLRDLEETGLLVTRQQVSTSDLADSPGPLASEQRSAEVTYRVHPLLAEMARRRMRGGGVEVERARAAVRRAVEVDVNRGELRHSLRRLLAVGDHERVVEMLGRHGVSLVLSGNARVVRSFELEHPELVEAEPACWFALALERWQSGPDKSARYWLHRVTAAARGGEHQGALPALDVACAHLMLGLLGDERLAEATTTAQEQLDTLAARRLDRAHELTLLHLLLGMAQLLLGDLEKAQQSLSTVALRGGSMDVKALHDDALSQLAVSEFLRGREHVVLILARSAGGQTSSTSLAGAGLGLAAELSSLQTAAGAEQACREEPRAALSFYDEDVIVRFLALLLESRRFLLRGLAADAGGILDAGLDADDLPDSLHISLLVEQALHAALCVDRARLRGLERQLIDAGARGEAAFVAGLRADVAGDLPTAITDFSFAAEHARCKQPVVAAIAATCLAQLLDATDRRDESLAALEEAVIATAARRNVMPFLGWSRHGSPVSRLLESLARTRPTPWVVEVAAWSAQRTGSIAGQAGAVTATPQERESVTAESVRVMLTPRERDVLHELARGSTYSGIAVNLFVSENTVKTHVSSLYSKLGVSRRTDALAVARTMRLL